MSQIPEFEDLRGNSLKNCFLHEKEGCHLSYSFSDWLLNNTARISLIIERGSKFVVTFVNAGKGELFFEEERLKTAKDGGQEPWEEHSA